MIFFEFLYPLFENLTLKIKNSRWWRNEVAMILGFRNSPTLKYLGIPSYK